MTAEDTVQMDGVRFLEVPISILNFILLFLLTLIILVTSRVLTIVTIGFGAFDQRSKAAALDVLLGSISTVISVSP